jgi:hypothetical protein
MKALFSFTLLVALSLTASVYTRAQEPSIPAQGQDSTAAVVATPASNTTPPAPQDANAVIYFYRIKQFAGSALEPSVFCDEKELARMDNGRYFGVALTPGKHTCRMGDKQTGFEIEAKPGQSFYAKITIDVGFLKGHGRLTLIQPEQGAFELKKVKLLGVDKVKDRALVTLHEGSEQARQ